MIRQDDTETFVHDLCGATPAVGENRAGQMAVVPTDERWAITRIELINTDAAGSHPGTVWFVPEDETFDPVTPTMTWVRMFDPTISSRTPSVVERDNGLEVVDTLEPGTTIWIDSDGADVLAVVQGWRLPA